MLRGGTGDKRASSKKKMTLTLQYWNLKSVVYNLQGKNMDKSEKKCAAIFVITTRNYIH